MNKDFEVVTLYEFDSGWVGDGKALSMTNPDRLYQEEVPFVRVSDVVDALEGLAEAMDAQGEHSLDDLACETYKAAASQVKALANNLSEKGKSDA